MSVALGGLYLASHTSDGAAGSFGMVQQVLETLFVVFGVLAIGVGVVVTRLLGSGDIEQAGRTVRAALGACTWAGLLVALWLVFGAEATLDVLRAHWLARESLLIMVVMHGSHQPGDAGRDIVAQDMACLCRRRVSACCHGLVALEKRRLAEACPCNCCRLAPNAIAS